MNTIKENKSSLFNEYKKTIHQACSRDRGRLYGLLRRCQVAPNDLKVFGTFESLLKESVSRCEARAASHPKVRVDEDLPIGREAEQIIALIRKHQVVVIAGETGSGKTTQLPKLCLAAGRGIAGMVGCTQPRRIAARSVARRVAEELEFPLGGVVGYQVRFTETVGEYTRIKFMTDGILLAEIASDRWLSKYDTIIIDEAHERSLNIDFLLGYLKQLLVKRRDLKVVVTSATIDTGRFSEHFDNAPVLSVEGRTYPVAVCYRPLDGDVEGEVGLSVSEGIVAAVDEITGIDGRGDVLIFLAGEREIRDVHQLLERRKYKETEVLPLYARLSAKDQDRVFNVGTRRRIVLATNVAETSLTVPGIRYVVDPGLARVKRYSARQKLDRLYVEGISQASANQRKGRCGRVADGVCYRLYSQLDFEGRAEFTDPEIRRSSLASTILRMLSSGLGDIGVFPFIEMPDERAIADGWQQLFELGAVDKERRLTGIGRQMGRLPVDVKLGRMLVAGQKMGCLREVLVIAAFLGIQDPRERPVDARAAADNAHAKFADIRSEFVGVLKLWEGYQGAHEELTQSGLRQWCEKHFLGFLRMREWRELHRQLLVLCQELGWSLNALPADYPVLHRALIAGLSTQIGKKEDKGDYIAPRQRRYQLFPGSILAKKPPPWVLSGTLLDTQRVWGLMNAAIEPAWVVAELEHLLLRKYFDPHWSRKQGHVVGSEQVSLFGLVLAPRRPVHYGRINPVEAHEIFVRQGLVTGEINLRAKFVSSNLQVLEKAQEEEAKLRRTGIVCDEDWQARWYFDRVPSEVHSAAGVEAWYKGLSQGEKDRLLWSVEDLLPGEGSEAGLYPKYLHLGDSRLRLHYKFEPGAVDDGVSLDVPLHLLNALDVAQLSWLAPGFVMEKATELIRGLPKVQRRNYIPAPDFAQAFYEAYFEGSGDGMCGELARFLSRTTGVAVAATDFDEGGLEVHLRMNLRLYDGQGKLLGESRSIEELRVRFGGQANQAFSLSVGRGLIAEGLEGFPEDPIPVSVIGEAGVAAYPALVDEGGRVALRVFADKQKADRLHVGGVRCLLVMALAERIKQARRQLPISSKTELMYAVVESQQRLREDLVGSALSKLLVGRLEGIREAQGFGQCCEEVGRQLFAEAVVQLKLAEVIIGEVIVLKPQLEGMLMGWASGNLADMQAHLGSLVYAGFLRDTPGEVLGEYPRYLKAIGVRAERAKNDPTKDQGRMLELKSVVDALEAVSCEVKASSAWQLLRWELEELRVSVFAQELGATAGVSVKRLMQKVRGL